MIVICLRRPGSWWRLNFSGMMEKLQRVMRESHDVAHITVAAMDTLNDVMVASNAAAHTREKANAAKWRENVQVLYYQVML